VEDALDELLLVVLVVVVVVVLLVVVLLFFFTPVLSLGRRMGHGQGGKGEKGKGSETHDDEDVVGVWWCRLSV